MKYCKLNGKSYQRQIDCIVLFSNSKLATFFNSWQVKRKIVLKASINTCTIYDCMKCCILMKFYPVSYDHDRQQHVLMYTGIL